MTSQSQKLKPSSIPSPMVSAAMRAKAPMVPQLRTRDCDLAMFPLFVRHIVPAVSRRSDDAGKGEGQHASRVPRNTADTLPRGEFLDPRGDLNEGVCPTCKKNDGYLNMGKGHWFYCEEHRVRWFFGSNLFSTWKLETEDEQHRKYDELGFGRFDEISPSLAK